MEKIAMQAKYKFNFIKRQEVWETLMSLGKAACRSSVMYKKQNSGTNESRKEMFEIKRKKPQKVERKVSFFSTKEMNMKNEM